MGHALARLLEALLDGGRNLFGLAVANTHLALAVPDGHKSGKGEPAATLDHLGDSIDMDNALVVLRPVGGALVTASPVAAVSARHNVSPSSRAASATALTRP